MKFADRLKIVSALSLGLLFLVAVLLIWSSNQLKSAEYDDALADEIQTIVFKRATRRDEYYLHGVERAWLQWSALNLQVERLLQRGEGQFRMEEDLQVFRKVQEEYEQSILVSRRLFQRMQEILSRERRMMHSDHLAGQLYSQVMLKDSALQQETAALQKMTRQRYNAAQDRMIALTFLFVLLVGSGTLLNSTYIYKLLRRRLAALNAGAGIAASGDFSHRIECEGNDELAQLARVFNSVAQKVGEYTEALRESEERFRLQLQELTNIYTHTPVGLFAVDRELRYLRLNERMAEFNCRPIEEHVRRTIDEVHPEGFVTALKEMWRPVLERGESILNLEVQGREDWPSGERHWLVSFQPLVAESGEVIGLTGSVLDLTERKRVEQMMAEVRQQLEQEVLQRTAKLSLANTTLLQEIEVRKNVEVELLAQQQKMQEMALNVAMAEERERDRIASELHDQVGQRLILAKIKTDTLASSLPSRLQAEAAALNSLIEQTIQDIRSLTFQIRPPLLASVGLEAALRWLGEELQADFGLQVSFSDDGSEKPLRYEVRSTVFQAVRELMLNVAKHADTNRCRVEFAGTGGCICIVVEDEGVGLNGSPSGGCRIRSGGFGLVNVKQKIEHLGGSFTIATKPEGGTCASITVPLVSAIEERGSHEDHDR